MKLLVLSPVFPDAPADGDRLRLGHWLRRLSRRHAVTLACLADPARPADWGWAGWAGPLEAVHRVAWPRSRRLAAALAASRRLPLGLGAADSAAMRDLADRLAGQGFDAVLAYRLKMAPYALRFRIPRFLDATDSMTRYAERRAAAAALAGKPLRARFWRGQAGRLAAWEARCAAEFDGVFFNARADRDAVAAMLPEAAARLKVAANGVELGRLPRARRRPGELLFVGNLAYAPNAEAVAWFASEVLPRLRARLPQARLRVVGGGAPRALRALEGTPGLSFEGFQADLRPWMARASAAVCPVATGAGRQNKLLEAFAAGLPAVASPLAAEGAEAVPGRHVLAAADAEGFAAACRSLLESPALGRRLAAAARTLVGRLGDWERNAAVLAGAMEEARRRPLW